MEGKQSDIITSTVVYKMMLIQPLRTVASYRTPPTLQQITHRVVYQCRSTITKSCIRSQKKRRPCQVTYYLRLLMLRILCSQCIPLTVSQLLVARKKPPCNRRVLLPDKKQQVTDSRFLYCPTKGHSTNTDILTRCFFMVYQYRIDNTIPQVPTKKVRIVQIKKNKKDCTKKGCLEKMTDDSFLIHRGVSPMRRRKS